MADWVKATPHELVAQIRMLVSALDNPAGMAASGLDAAAFAELTSNAADLEAKVKAVMAAEAAYHSAIRERNVSFKLGGKNLRRYGVSAGRYTNMTDPLRRKAGLTVPDRKPSPGALPMVQDLVCLGKQNGNNFLNWSPMPGGRAVIWEVECSLGSSGEWFLVGATSRTDFLHEGAGAGTHRLYRVIARRGNRRGDPGNIASVYGG